MIKIDGNDVEMSGGKVIEISEAVEIMRILKHRYNMSVEEIDKMAELANLSKEELEKKAFEESEKMIIKIFLEFVEEHEDCSNCKAVKLCPIKLLYDDVKSGKAGAKEIVSFTLFSKFKNMFDDKKDSPFEKMFGDKKDNSFEKMFGDLL